jgi:flagellar export protein FliJ
MSTVDEGLQAVARVREMREQDSRHGLRLALQEQRRREEDARRYLDRIEQAPSFVTGSTADFQAGRAALASLSSALTTAQQQIAAGRVVTESAREHWQSDKTRLNAVEMLLDRRAAERAAAADRVEAKELDDIGARLWLRRRRKNSEVPR